MSRNRIASRFVGTFSESAEHAQSPTIWLITSCKIIQSSGWSWFGRLAAWSTDGRMAVEARRVFRGRPECAETVR